MWTKGAKSSFVCYLTLTESLNILFGFNKSFAQMLCFNLWARHCGNFSGFLHGVLFMTFSLAEGVCSLKAAFFFSSFKTTLKQMLNGEK